MGQYRLFSFRFKLPDFLGPDFIDGFTHFTHNMKSIQDMNRLTGYLGNHLQIGFPHVAANETNPGRSFWAELLKERTQGFLGPLLTDPEQSPTAGINLIDQSQVLRPLAPGNLIEADSCYV